MKIIINKNSKDDHEKLMKIFIALGKDFEVIEEKAKDRGFQVKTEAQIKQEIKTQAEKPPKPPKDPKNDGGKKEDKK
jgi:phage regulator Rha-like protein